MELEERVRKERFGVERKKEEGREVRGPRERSR